MDGDFSRSRDRHGLGVFALATLQTGEVGESATHTLVPFGDADAVALIGGGGLNALMAYSDYAYILNRWMRLGEFNLSWELQLAGWAGTSGCLMKRGAQQITGAERLWRRTAVALPFLDLIGIRASRSAKPRARVPRLLDMY